MSIQPTDFLDSARSLMEKSDEMSVRNSISRAYYAAYHLIQSVFPPDKEFAKNSRAGVHKTYIDQLMQADAGSVERQAGVALGALKGRRTKADYSLDCDMKPYEASMQIARVEDVQKSITAHSEGESCGTDVSPVQVSTPKLQRVR